MTTPLETGLCYREMALRRCSDMNHIRPCLLEKFLKVRKPAPHGEAVHKLPRHKRLAVADRHDFGSGDPQDLGCMCIGDLAAPDDCCPKHAAPYCGTH